jgi:hypothetical protein
VVVVIIEVELVVAAVIEYTRVFLPIYSLTLKVT